MRWADLWTTAKLLLPFFLGKLYQDVTSCQETNADGEKLILALLEDPSDFLDLCINGRTCDFILSSPYFSSKLSIWWLNFSGRYLHLWHSGRKITSGSLSLFVLRRTKSFRGIKNPTSTNFENAEWATSCWVLLMCDYFISVSRILLQCNHGSRIIFFSLLSKGDSFSSFNTSLMLHGRTQRALPWVIANFLSYASH